jgi:hypothetical protein
MVGMFPSMQMEQRVTPRKPCSSLLDENAGVAVVCEVKLSAVDSPSRGSVESWPFVG